MMKRFFSCVVLTGTLVAAGYAQSPDNVEKAVRFRVLQPANSTVQTAINPGGVEKQSLELNDATVEHRSSQQLEELGGYLWNSNAAQLQELGKKFRYDWMAGSSTQLDELGKKYVWWKYGK
jgi:hypothetical protein